MRLRDVLAATRLSRSSVYRLLNTGNFPQPVRIGPRAVAWHVSDINQWVANLKPHRPAA